MKILIVGLGVIGGSYAIGLSKKHTVYGVDNNEETIIEAKEKGCIVEGGQDASCFIPLVDLIILAIYPSEIIPFIKNNEFKKGQIITDVAGVKDSFIYKISEYLPEGVEFVGTHPMAGKEKRGFSYADSNVFKNANFLITPLDCSENTIEIIKGIATDLEFKRISVMSPKRHDLMIAFTSQLTHAIAVSLVNTDDDIETPLYTGDSYRDLTRIAQINENLWSELFLENKDNLLLMIQNFENQLDIMKNAIKNKDKNKLEELFIASTIKRSRFNEKN